MRNFPERTVVEKNKTFFSPQLFHENLVVYEIMW